ncbi:tetratricopeptide repeat protein [Salinimicrobium sp. CDJ15-81-2]|nr:tetratricopeptide repeat protein [Salinimicrobium nanhaiense]
MKSFGEIFIFLILLLPVEVIAQNFPLTDSIEDVYESNPAPEQELNQLLDIAVALKNPDSIHIYSSRAIEVAKASSNEEGLLNAFQIHGVAWRYKADYTKALEYLFMALELAEKLNIPEEIGSLNIEIGNVYSVSGNNELALVYYSRGLNVLREQGNDHLFGKGLFNLADDMLKNGMIDSSFAYTKEAQGIFRKHKDTLAEAYALGNLGMIYARRGENKKAGNHLIAAIDLLEKEKDYSAITEYLSSMADIYLDDGNERAAIFYGERSLETAENYNLRGNLQDIHLKLSNIYEGAGNTAQAFDHFKQYVLYKDSIRNIQSIEEMANLRSDFEISRKQIQVDLLNEQQANQRNVVIAVSVALFLIALLAFGLYRRNKHIGRTKKIIEKEKNRSDLLLLNILPQETAMELKEQGKVQAKRFEAVTILFTDFQNFTHFSENLSPEELVKSVDFYFSKFDEIVEQHGLEKIKTVGDAFMCAAGVPFPVEDHAERTLAAACDMVAFVKDAKKLDTADETRFDIRIGINSGPVVAGVVGSKKWAYDIWGDAVNIAARMESCSQSGEINISENTYDLIKDKFDCHYRGEIMVKNKGMMKMYFVIGRKHISQPNVA